MEATVLIEDLGKDGEGVGRAGGRVVFVPGATIGDRVRVRFPDDRRAYARAELVEIVETSPLRETPACPIASLCGGCQTMDLDYGAELAAKERRLKDALRRIGRLPDPPVEPIVGATRILRYREKATMPAGMGPEGIVFGYYARGTHHLVPVDDCLVLDEAVQEAAHRVRDVARQAELRAYDPRTGEGEIESLLVRHTTTGETLVVLTVARPVPKEPWVTLLPGRLPSLRALFLAVERNPTNRLVGRRTERIWGRPFVMETLLGRRFRISPASFFQANPSMAEEIFGAARESVRERQPRTLLDLYAGTGTLALLVADGVEAVEGIEVVEAAARDASANARLNGLKGVRFFSGPADIVLKERLEAGMRYDVVALDPPRRGAAEAVPLILEASPLRIVYISCDPATLARDAALLAEGGYRLTRARPFDLFPRTVHVETLAVLDRA